MNFEDLSDCIITYEQSLAELEEIETKLAKRFNLNGYIEDINYHGTIRENLIYQLIYEEEDELVQDWNQHFSSYYYFLKDDFPEKYVELYVFIRLCHYHSDCMYKSFVDPSNRYYQNILHCGRMNVIPALIKYISFAWPVFSLLCDISGNDMHDFPIEHSGKLDEVTKYWLNWAKK